MPKYDSPLDNLKIASPCSASWDEMYGSDRNRFCGECKRNVYNLSGMTRENAEHLLLNSEDGRLCVRFYKRADGTVLTNDCPVGWEKVRQRLSVYSTAAFSLLLSFLSGSFLVSMFSSSDAEPREIPYIFTSPPPAQTMGAVAISPDDRKNVVGQAVWEIEATEPEKQTTQWKNDRVMGKIALPSDRAD